MTITTEDLRKLLDGVRAPETSLSVSFQIAACRNKLEGASESLAAELITARAKIEAAENLAEAVKHEREMVCQDMGMQMDLSAWTDEMLAKWESLK